MPIHRGDIVWVNLDPVVGHEVAKARPALVIQNDTGNLAAPTTIVAAVTAHSDSRATFPFCVELPAGVGGLRKRSVANCAHIRTIDKVRIRRRLGAIPTELMTEVDQALRISLDL